MQSPHEEAYKLHYRSGRGLQWHYFGDYYVY
ncbi:MAG: hypothetical protein ACI89A_000133 [Porticoccaceae bacterium]|jgi:hypothetical protein